MKIRLSKDEELETSHYSVEQLEMLLVQVDEKKLICDGQIERAKAQAVQSGEYADATWWASVKMARKRLAQARTLLSQEIASRKRARRQEGNVQSDLPKHFVKVAKERLSDLLFEQLMAEAMQRYANSQRGVEVLSNYVFEVGE